MVCIDSMNDKGEDYHDIVCVVKTIDLLKTVFKSQILLLAPVGIIAELLQNKVSHSKSIHTLIFFKALCVICVPGRIKCVVVLGAQSHMTPNYCTPTKHFHNVFYFIDNSSNYGKRFVLGFTQQNDHTGYIQISIVAKRDANVTITALTSSRPLFTFHIKAG